MKSERSLNRIIWGATIIFLIFAIVLEFRIDKLLIKCWYISFSGHREFFINIMLGGFASGIITGITTWIAFSAKKQIIEERANRYLYDIRKYFKLYCDSISNKDKKNLFLYLKKFEDAMTDFINCVDSNDCENKKYGAIRAIYCEKISWNTTRALNYEYIFMDQEGNINLLFEDLSNHMLSDIKDDFCKALNNILGEENDRVTLIYDPVFEKQISEVKERYSLGNDV